MNVESTSSGSPCSCASAATRGMSSTSSPGLPSVSPKQEPRVRPDRRAPGVEIARIDERRLDAEARQRVIEQVVRPAVERARCDDVRPAPTAASRSRDASPPVRSPWRSRPRRLRARRSAPPARRRSGWRSANRRGPARSMLNSAAAHDRCPGTRTTPSGRSASRARRSQDRARRRRAATACRNAWSWAWSWRGTLRATRARKDRVW